MQNDKLVSIVLPVYNGEKYLKQSIESVLNQTYENLELIIVNDNSTDSSLDIAKEFERIDSRVKVISNPRNLKLPSSLNNGFKNANGEYYTWTSDDNYYENNAIEEMVNYLESNQDKAMVCCNQTIIDLRANNNRLFKPSLSVQDMLINNYVGACFLYRKTAADAIGEYNPKKFLIEDYDYWLRMMLYGNIGHLDKNLYNYRMRSDSLSGTREKEVLIRREKILKEYAPLYRKKFKDIKIKVWERENKDNLPIIQKFFSIRNENTHKVLRILGIKIKLRKKRYTERLTSEEWGNLYNISSTDKLCSDIKNNNLSVQTKEILKLTKKGMNVLEIGCGSGQSSLCLSSKGRFVTALDYEQKCLDLVTAVSTRLNLDVKTKLCNAFKEMPFDFQEFDLVFHAGLLEHFSQEERINFLRSWRPSCKTMVSMVPNAASIAYRTGKAIMEKNGTWEYGIETPLYTQIPEFIEAGYNVKAEYTIGAKHALNFLNDSSELKQIIKSWLDTNLTEDDCHQGYLLVTVGENINA